MGSAPCPLQKKKETPRGEGYRRGHGGVLGRIWVGLAPSVDQFWPSRDPLGTHFLGPYRWLFRSSSKYMRWKAFRGYNPAFWAIPGAFNPLLASAGCAKR